MASNLDNPNPQVFSSSLDLDDQFLIDRKAQELDMEIEDQVDSLEGKSLLRVRSSSELTHKCLK